MLDSSTTGGTMEGDYDSIISRRFGKLKVWNVRKSMLDCSRAGGKMEEMQLHCTAKLVNEQCV